jgi:hypothetical protein
MAFPIYSLTERQINAYESHGMLVIKPLEPGRLDRIPYFGYEIDVSRLKKQPLFAWRRRYTKDAPEVILASFDIINKRGEHLPQNKLIFGANPNKKFKRIRVETRDGREEITFIYNGNTLEKNLNEQESNR